MTERELAAVEKVGNELQKIRQVLEALVPEQEPEQPESTECPHPEDQRIDFGMTNGLPDWQCRLCNFRTVTE